MLQGFDESEMLGWVEGDLSPDLAKELRARLQSTPRAQAMLESMKQDRSVLRALPEPSLPADFLARLEPILARPMLMDPIANETATAKPSARPGEFRRQQKRLTRRIRWGRLAAAAVVVLAIPAGIWAALHGFPIPDRQQQPELIARGDDRLAPEKSPALPPLSGTIHHHRRQSTDSTSNAVASISDGGPYGLQPPKDAASKVPASFAIVVRSSDVDKTEAAIDRSASAFGQRAGVVRNFSFDEAQRLARGMGKDISESSSAQPMIASADLNSKPRSHAELRKLADEVRRYLQEAKAAPPVGAEASSESAQLVGDPEVAPSLEQQLEFSSRGAAYTIAVPAEQLAAFIERVSVMEGQATALRMLPSRDVLPNKAPDEPWQPLTFWLNEGPQVRQAVEQLTRSRAHSIVLLPVIVQHETEPRRQ